MSRVKQKHNISFYPILISATLITLYFNPGFADPFNSAKLYLLVLSLPILMIYIDKKRINLVSKIDLIVVECIGLQKANKKHIKDGW